jgi:hypothetical protein
MNNLKNIEWLFRIVDRSINTIQPPLGYRRLTTAIIKLANMVHAYDGDDLWAIGENGSCDLGSFIVGAYWHFSEWHEGQWSDSYKALCALGQVFSPGRTSSPEEDTSEFDVYTQLAKLAEGVQA